jgi:RNA-directed DNA polymerase
MTIGAPSSPLLSNILMYEFDLNVHEWCRNRGIIYTRYADDMFFSTNRANLLKEAETFVLHKVNTISCPHNLEINHKKTRHVSKKGRRNITGLVITSSGEISVGRKRKRYIKS